MKLPKELHTITDVVLAYKPPDKVKATNRRQKRKAKRDAKKAPRRLTDSQERRLHAALTFDDLLYRKFERMMFEFREVQRRIAANCSILKVLADDGGGALYALPVIKAHQSPEGQTVIVRVPKQFLHKDKKAK